MDFEQRIMPETVSHSHKSGIKHNLLGSLLTLTFILQNLDMTDYLRVEVGFPGHLLPTARPEVSATLSTYFDLNRCVYFLIKIGRAHV